ncbi:hypothetical protein [Methanosarcina sp.]|uniref:hypothetical protein n=1 Tax=Methanosarcina sp. TaxID=2213 RepID=UPI003C74C879
MISHTGQNEIEETNGSQSVPHLREGQVINQDVSDFLSFRTTVTAGFKIILEEKKQKNKSLKD